jgi:hypothetical protein
MNPFPDKVMKLSFQYIKNISRIIIVLVFFITAGIPSSVLPRGEKYRFENLRCDQENLVVDFIIEDLITKEIIQGLRKGMTAALEYHIQIRKERGGWVDQVVHERYVRMKIGYDPWEKRYALFYRDPNPTFLSEDRMKFRCSQLTAIPLIPIEKLEPQSRYIIAIQITLVPMSVENYQDIKRWLSGEVRDLHPKDISSGKSPGKKAGDWFVGLILNLSGFGDRILSIKSPTFLWQNGSAVLEKSE